MEEDLSPKIQLPEMAYRTAAFADAVTPTPQSAQSP
jgi:hypothetical protein